jgi:hypothetical protein
VRRPVAAFNFVFFTRSKSMCRLFRDWSPAPASLFILDILAFDVLACDLCLCASDSGKNIKGKNIQE